MELIIQGRMENGARNPKIHNDSIAITATTVRVPVARSHSEAINIETEKTHCRRGEKAICPVPGYHSDYDPAEKKYPMPLFTSDRDEVFVGRIREDNSIANGLNIWVVADQIRKGAATNTVQIAELVVKYGCLPGK